MLKDVLYLTANYCIPEAWPDMIQHKTRMCCRIRMPGAMTLSNKYCEFELLTPAKRSASWEGSVTTQNASMPVEETPENNDFMLVLCFVHSVTLNIKDVMLCVQLLSSLYQQESSTVRYFSDGCYESRSAYLWCVCLLHFLVSIYLVLFFFYLPTLSHHIF